MSKSKIFLSLTAGLLFAATLPAMGQAVPSKDSIPKLVSVIKSGGTEKEKMDACRQLAIVGGKEAVAALAALLEDEKYSHMARYGLETIPDPSVNEALRAALGKVKGRLLAGVIGSLGVRQDEIAMTLLPQYLSDSDPLVVQATVRAMGSIGNVTAYTYLKATWAKAPAQNRVAVAEGMLRCAERQIVRLHPKEALDLYDTLRQSPEAPHQVRTAALRGAILERKQDGLALLKESLANPDYAIFSAAARISMEMTGSEVTKALAAELGKGAPDRQVLVARTLGGRHDPAALDALMTAAQAGDKAVRLDALRAIGEIPHTGILDGLSKLMDDPDKEIAQAAQEVVASTAGNHADAIVTKMLANASVGKRLTALEMIGRRRMADAVPALLKAADDTNYKVRANAMKLVGDLGGANEVTALLGLMNTAKVTSDIAAAEEAITVLCEKKADPEGCAAKLTPSLAKANPQQKSALVRILGSVSGPTALKAVRAAVDDTNADVRVNAIRVLGSWKTADAAPELLALAKASAKPDEKVLFVRGYLSLAANTDIPQAERLTMCQEGSKLAQSTDEKRLLLAALGAIASPNSLTLIRPHLDDKATIEEASAATLAVTEKLVAGSASAKSIEPLEKVVQSSSNANLVQKAKKLLDEAKKKAVK